MRIIYQETLLDFLSKLEPPRFSRYAYRLIETTLRDADGNEIQDLERLESIVRDANKDLKIWDHFDVHLLRWEGDTEGVDTGDIFVNDIFLSQKRYSVVFQIYVVPWAKLDLFFGYDAHAIGIMYKGNLMESP